MADYFVDSVRGDDTNGNGAWKTALAGTITMTNGSAAVSATGAAFTTELWAGAWICLDADETADVWGQVSSITDDNNAALAANYAGTGGSGAASKLSNWKTIQNAVQAGGLVAGDNVWTRRGHSEIPIANVQPAYSGAADNPITIRGWSRNAKVLVGNVINGYSCVWGLSITAVRAQHQTRRIKFDSDGKWYLITHIGQDLAYDGQTADFIIGEAVTGGTSGATGIIIYDSDLGTDGTLVLQGVSGTFQDNEIITSISGSATTNIPTGIAPNFIIDRKFAGTTTSAGALTIQADDDYSIRPDIGSLRTIWDADSGTLPLINFNNTGYQFYWYTIDYLILENIELRDSTNSYGVLFGRNSKSNSMIGCLFKQSNNTSVVRLRSFFYIERIIIEGSGSGTSQVGLFQEYQSSHLTDCAIYNCGDNGIKNQAFVFLENVNIGVEMPNGDIDIQLRNVESGVSITEGRDVKLGGTNGYAVLSVLFNKMSKLSIENYQKEMGRQKQWFLGGEIENIAVGDTNAPSVADATGKTTDLMEILPNVSGLTLIEDWAVDIFTGEEDAISGARTYTLYFQNNTGGTLNASTAKDDIWLVAEYVSQYSTADAYVIEKAYSAETAIAQRADDTDWDSLSVTLTTAVASKVRLKLYISTYSATGGIYVGGIAVA